jgi:hypothetical protein
MVGGRSNVPERLRRRLDGGNRAGGWAGNRRPDANTHRIKILATTAPRARRQPAARCGPLGTRGSPTTYNLGRAGLPAAWPGTAGELPPRPNAGRVPCLDYTISVMMPVRHDEVMRQPARSRCRSIADNPAKQSISHVRAWLPYQQRHHHHGVDGKPAPQDVRKPFHVVPPYGTN